MFPQWIVFSLVFQIAAKIGGDSGPPMNNNNNTASDVFAFTAQKRQLEDAGTSGVSLIYWPLTRRLGQKRPYSE